MALPGSRSRSRLLVALACAFACASGVAHAQSAPPPRPGVHMHDGFMARLTGGFGTGRTNATGTDSVGEFEREQSGFTGSLSLDIGGSVAENLIVHGRLANCAIVSPDLTLDGRELGEQERTSITAYLLGAGVSYYLMPLNLYATAAVGFGSLRFASSRDFQQYTRPGFSLNADVGKEWWISHDVGLGAALRLWYSRATQEDAEIQLDATHDFLAWSLLASFTWQ